MTDKNIVIVNTQIGEITLPPWSSHPDIEHRDGQRLLGGENNVLAAYWSHCKGLNNRGLQIYLASELLVEKGPGKAVDYSKGLDVLTKGEALRQIEKCTSVGILKTWKEQSEKKYLKTACSKKIDSLVKDQE